MTLTKDQIRIEGGNLKSNLVVQRADLFSPTGWLLMRLTRNNILAIRGKRFGIEASEREAIRAWMQFRRREDVMEETQRQAMNLAGWHGLIVT
jgi:hypothetical protein